MNIADYKSELQLPLRKSTLCFLVRDDEILLAMKKRGFGKDRWNGVGGKPDGEETILETAIRETQEEIEVTPQDMELVAVLDFYFSNNPDWNQQVAAYFSRTWEGEPKETEEMKPEWYKKDGLPFEAMWPDDDFWLRPVLSGSKVKAEFLFGENDAVLDHNVVEVDILEV
jgi:8-oxo-dGTP pyrophosphatase MutT (NUDIX family)